MCLLLIFLLDGDESIGSIARVADDVVSEVGVRRNGIPHLFVKNTVEGHAVQVPVSLYRGKDHLLFGRLENFPSWGYTWIQKPV